MRPSGTPYEPSDGIAIDTQSPSGVPRCHERTWSMAAFAADAADDRTRALMMAAPRWATVGMYVSAYQASSPTSSAAFRPFTSAWNRSANWVAEWLPQIVIFLMSETVVPVFAASWATARLWSRRVIAVNRPGSRSGALFMAMSELVFAGLPTTRIFTSFFAEADSAWPWGLK